MAKVQRAVRLKRSSPYLPKGFTVIIEKDPWKENLESYDRDLKEALEKNTNLLEHQISDLVLNARLDWEKVGW